MSRDVGVLETFFHAALKEENTLSHILVIENKCNVIVRVS